MCKGYRGGSRVALAKPGVNKINEEKIKKFKLHKEVVEEGSRLSLVEEKELEIQGKVLEAKKHAEQILEEARRKALAPKEKANEEGWAYAKKFYQQELLKVQRDAEKIKQSIPPDVKSMEEKGARNLEEAVSFLWRKIIP